MSRAWPAAVDDAARVRLHAARLMLGGKTPAQAALAVGVARQTAYKWKARLERGGLDALRGMANGRPAQLDAEGLERVRAALRQGALAHGFDTDRWTVRRIGELIHRRCGVQYSDVHLRRLFRGAPGLEAAEPLPRRCQEFAACSAARNRKASTRGTAMTSTTTTESQIAPGHRARTAT